MSARVRNDSPVHDIIGIGFGPANLALAIAIEEHNATSSAGKKVTAAFVERSPEFSWHRGMLIDGAVMQVSFLKDLATMRNPTSDFGFVSYLYGRGRLADFINHKILFPTREEFHDYLSWAARRCDHLVRYGSEVVELRPVHDGADVPVVEINCADGSGYQARNVVFATGLAPTVPSGVELSDRVWHSSELLHRVPQYTDPGRFVVVGAGQSAAEVTEYLHRRFPSADVYAVFTRYGYSPADDSPFANRIFDPDAVGEFFNASDEVKERLLDYHRNTNYSVVDLDLIQDLYRREYQEKVRGQQRLHMINAARVVDVADGPDAVGVDVHHLLDGSVTRIDADVAVFATGYQPADIRPILGVLDRHCHRDSAGMLLLDRDYRIVTSDAVGCGLYLQGGTEHTHGLSSTLLSNVAVRAGEILESILGRRAAGAVPFLRAA